MLERGAKIQLINMVSFIFCLFYVKTIKHVIFILYNCQVTGHSGITFMLGLFVIAGR